MDGKQFVGLMAIILNTNMISLDMKNLVFILTY